MERGREKFLKYKKIINILILMIKVLPTKTRLSYFYHIRNKNGKLGLVLRYITLKSLAKSVGDNVSIQPGVYIFNPHELIIGNNVSIHPMCYIEAYGGIEIGNDVSIAHATTILSVNHFYKDYTMPIKNQGVESRPTKICDNVWIGAKVTILGGVNVNNGGVIAAGAVVTKDTEKDTVIAGIPAIKIRRR